MLVRLDTKNNYVWFMSRFSLIINKVFPLYQSVINQSTANNIMQQVMEPGHAIDLWKKVVLRGDWSY